MKRRTFTKKTSSLGIAALLAPLVSLNAQHRLFSKSSELSPAMQAHIAHFKQEMSLGISEAGHRETIQNFGEPTQIITSKTTMNGYRLEYRNRHQQRIILSATKGKLLTQILS